MVIYGHKAQIGIVIECYDHDISHRIVVVRSVDKKVYYFFYIPITPQVAFGDKFLMNFTKDQYYVSRGNSRLTYKITPLVFPGTLLLELITERMNL